MALFGETVCAQVVARCVFPASCPRVRNVFSTPI
jgi:hypothetical protein